MSQAHAYFSDCWFEENTSAENDSGSSSDSSTHVVDQSSKLVQPTLEVITTESDKTKAEIIWTLKCIESGYSDNSNNDMIVVFKCMFPDSKTASSFQMEPDKLHYYVTFWLAPYFKSLPIDLLKKSDCHVLSLDESLNDFTQTSKMDLLVRFFDNSTLLTPDFMIVVFWVIPLTKIYINSLMIYQMN